MELQAVTFIKESMLHMSKRGFVMNECSSEQKTPAAQAESKTSMLKYQFYEVSIFTLS